MNNKFQKSLKLAIAYILSIYAALYFMPMVAAYLDSIYMLNIVLDGSYVVLGFALIVLCVYRYHMFDPRAFILFGILFILFVFEFYNVQFLVERFHYLEYAIVYVLWFRVFRYLFKGILRYGVTLWWSVMLGAIDEGIQYFLPTRVFELRDIFLNVEGVLFGMVAVAIWMAYRKDPGRDAEYVLSR